MGGDSSTEPSPPAPAAIAPLCARRVHDRHEEDRSGREVRRSYCEYCRAVRPFRGHCWYSVPSCRWPASRRTAPRPHGSAVSAAHASVRSEVFECLMCSTVAHGSGLIGHRFSELAYIRIPGRALSPACLTLNRGAGCSRRMLLEARVGAFPAVGCGGSRKAASACQGVSATLPMRVALAPQAAGHPGPGPMGLAAAPIIRVARGRAQRKAPGNLRRSSCPAGARWYLRQG
jgi:hypothetical protein